MTDTDASSQERDPTPPPQEEPEQGSRSWRVWATAFIAPVVGFALTSAFVMQAFLIPSGSMEETLHVGDRVLVNKLAYRFGDIGRGDIVVFDGTGSFVHDASEPGPVARVLRAAGGAVGLTPSGDTDYIKRVIGIGGDRVVCCDAEGMITVNGKQLEEPYLYPGDEPSATPFDIEVPAGRLWVLGDHRSDSSDSRDHLGSPGGGTVAEGRVIGRAEAVVWPPSRTGGLRADRG
ncbi:MULTISPECIES: signal peptidase I [Streptomyces]|uniref:signal peptidase I n=1 Tax=Streptomyces TaxID=1883 RepID=UPI000CD4B331|nr:MULTISPECIES: signal peptidase I [Streptomyces]